MHCFRYLTCICTRELHAHADKYSHLITVSVHVPLDTNVEQFTLCIYFANDFYIYTTQVANIY